MVGALARHVAGDGARLDHVDAKPLAGGFVSRSVERLTLDLVTAAGAPVQATFVCKT